MKKPDAQSNSDHCVVSKCVLKNGWRFFNPDGVQARSFSDLPKWWWQRLILRQGSRWPAKVADAVMPQLPVSVPAGQMAITFIGQATFLLQFPNLNLLTDPIFSERASPFSWAGPKRVRPPALSLAQLPRIDVVLLSHNHYDHLDLDSLRWLTLEQRPLIVTTLGNKAWLEKRGVGHVVELDWWQAHLCPNELTLTCTPAHHFAARWPWDRCETLWGGFMIKTSAGTVFFCGDTSWGSHFTEIHQRLGAPDLALLPIGAYEPRWFMNVVHMNPAEAVRAHLALGARRSIGMHFGTFQLTDEGIDQPASDLSAARLAANLDPTAFIVPLFGETKLSLLASGGHH